MTGWHVAWIAAWVYLIAMLLTTPEVLRHLSKGDDERFTTLLRWRTITGLAALALVIPLFVIAVTR